MPRRRLGVVLLVEPPLAGEIDGLRRACGDGSLGRVPAHITLVPPVNVPAAGVEEALSVLRTAASATTPFEVTIGPAATFHPVTPVLYLAVGGEGLAELGRLRERVFVGPLTRTLTHPFVPHVTLADDMAPDRIEAACRALADYRVTARFERVHLLEERPGRVWEPAADAPFRAPAVVGRGGLALELEVTERIPPDAASLLDTWSPPGPPARGRSVVVTARRGGRVVGVAAGTAEAGVSALELVAVDPAHVGEGIGDHLVDAFRSWASTDG